MLFAMVLDCLSTSSVVLEAFSCLVVMCLRPTLDIGLWLGSLLVSSTSLGDLRLTCSVRTLGAGGDSITLGENALGFSCTLGGTWALARVVRWVIVSCWRFFGCLMSACSWRMASLVVVPMLRKGDAGAGLRRASTRSSIAAAARSVEEVSGMVNLVGKKATVSPWRDSRVCVT